MTKISRDVVNNNEKEGTRTSELPVAQFERATYFNSIMSGVFPMPHHTKSLFIVRHWEFILLELKGQAQLLKNNPMPYPPPTIYILYTIQSYRCPTPDKPPNPDLSIKAWWLCMICQSRECIYVYLEFSSTVLYKSASKTLHYTYWRMDAAAQSWKSIPLNALCALLLSQTEGYMNFGDW